jgi:hypothetical protein
VEFMNGTMRNIALTAGILLFPTMMFAAEGRFEKTLPAGAGLVASVSTGSGFIHIVPSSSNEVHIIGHVHASHGWMGGGSDEDVKEVSANPPIDVSGSTIRIGGRNEGA